MTIGIRAVGCHVPKAHVDNIEQGAAFGESEEFIRTKIGATRLPRLEPGRETSDLACAAVKDLVRSRPECVLEEVDALVVVTQNPDSNGLPHTASIVHRKLDLPKSVAAFDLSLGCSGYVHGLYALKGFMESAGLRSGLLITADPYSKIVDPKDRVTSLLFGDGDMSIVAKPVCDAVNAWCPEGFACSGAREGARARERRC